MLEWKLLLRAGTVSSNRGLVKTVFCHSNIPFFGSLEGTGNGNLKLLFFHKNYLHTGPCINTRNTMDTEVDCDENGNFRPLQCHQVSDGTHTCHCVHPRNGSMVPNTMRRGITQREDAPDCESRGIRLISSTA